MRTALIAERPKAASAAGAAASAAARSGCSSTGRGSRSRCSSTSTVSPAAASSCRECGKAFPVKARELDQVEGELSEVEVTRLRVEAKRAQAAAQTLEDLIAEGQRRGFKNPAGWARHVWDGRMKKRAGARA